MTLKVIVNTVDFALFDNLDAGETYIVFGHNNKVYSFDLNDGTPDFNFWKSVCVGEKIHIDDIILDELDEESITTEQMSAVYKVFGNYDDFEDDRESVVEAFENGYADYRMDELKDRYIDELNDKNREP